MTTAMTEDNLVESTKTIPLRILENSTESTLTLESAELTGEVIFQNIHQEIEIQEGDLELGVPEANEEKSFNTNLPAALCDEVLLSEIAAIPQKFGFKIGDVAELLGVKPYILRYWETEFEMLKPKKAANNQRYYTKKHVENAFLVRKLLHRDKFSIQGAKAALRDLRQVVRKEKNWTQINEKVGTLEERVDHILLELRQLRNLFI